MVEDENPSRTPLFIFALSGEGTTVSSSSSLSLTRADMMDSSRLLKKPKLEDEPIELIEGDNEGKPSNYNKSRDDNVSMQEQEEALVALIEHRTKECQLLKQKLAHYKSQVFDTVNALCVNRFQASLCLLVSLSRFSS